MPTVTVNDVALAYDDDGQGTPLVLLHAGIADRRMWDAVLPSLAAQHRVIRVDLRGFGETPLPDGPFTHAADIAGLLTALGVDRTHLCGVSMGAAIALDLAVAHPQLVERLVLVAPGLEGWDWDSTMHEFDAAETAAIERADLDAAAWLNVGFWLDGPHRSPDDVDKSLRRQVFGMQRHAFGLDNPAAEESRLVPSVRERLGDLTAPTLVVVGELDQPDYAAIGRHLAARLRDGHVTVQPAVAHLPPMEAPAAFAQLVLDHLAGSGSSS